MIPIPWLGRVPWRLIVLGLLLVALLAFAWRVRVWHEAFEALPAAQEALQREIECGAGSECLRRSVEAQAKAEAASAVVLKGYEDEIQKLRDMSPAPAVRLCRPAARGSVRDAATADPADGAAAGRDVPLEASGDIGQRLFDLADEADREALKLRYLQQWNAALAAPDAVTGFVSGTGTDRR